ncbi:hypothetical protein N8772_02965 [Rickettsiales bacterium]|nr:hypothetical protein [Rickettsiales bacterium]MDB2550287.1 hypothetical protein [Rickettsiales bacterium]
MDWDISKTIIENLTFGRKILRPENARNIIDCVCLSLCCAKSEELISDEEFKKADKMHRGIFLKNLAKLIEIEQILIKDVEDVRNIEYNKPYVSLIYSDIDKDPAIHSVYHFQIFYIDNNKQVHTFEERALSGGSPFSNHDKSPESLPSIETIEEAVICEGTCNSSKRFITLEDFTKAVRVTINKEFAIKYGIKERKSSASSSSSANSSLDYESSSINLTQSGPSFLQKLSCGLFGNSSDATSSDEEVPKATCCCFTVESQKNANQKRENLGRDAIKRNAAQNSGR